MSYALIVVDMQNDFITGPLGTKEAISILPGVLARVQEALDDPDCAQVIFTMDTHENNYMDTQEGRRLPVPHCIHGSDGWSLAEPLRARLGDKSQILEKGAFGCPRLPAAIKRGVKKAELVGVCTDICVISNAILLKSALPELTVQVDAKLCAGVTPESHERALQTMEVCHVDVCR